MTVHQFPTRYARTSTAVTELRAACTAVPLTAAEVQNAPADVLRSPGPFVMPPESFAAAQLERVQAIVGALLGPGRVPLVEGLHECIETLDFLLRTVDE